jgi:hypothetical protein
VGNIEKLTFSSEKGKRRNHTIHCKKRQEGIPFNGKKQTENQNNLFDLQT